MRAFLSNFETLKVFTRFQSLGLIINFKPLSQNSEVHILTLVILRDYHTLPPVICTLFATLLNSDRHVFTPHTLEYLSKVITIEHIITNFITAVYM